jgi:FRG domain
MTPPPRSRLFLFPKKWNKSRMAEIKPPPTYSKEISSLRDYIDAISDWFTVAEIQEHTFLGTTWYRGNGAVFANPLVPGVYRDSFTDRAKKFHTGPLENRRQYLERVMLREFRTAGASFFDANDVVDVYLNAQHYGMPTRLLDWTTNPLAALFFATECVRHHKVDGEVFAVEPKAILPDPDKQGNEVLWNAEVTRHPYVAYAIGQSFWHRGKPKAPRIIPVIPDNRLGRVGQQSSCFTLHMHEAPDCSVPNDKLAKFKIVAKGNAKVKILDELLRIKINQFTIFNNLDSLSMDIKRVWGIDL